MQTFHDLTQRVIRFREKQLGYYFATVNSLYHEGGMGADEAVTTAFGMTKEGKDIVDSVENLCKSCLSGETSDHVYVCPECKTVRVITTDGSPFFIPEIALQAVGNYFKEHFHV